LRSCAGCAAELLSRIELKQATRLAASNHVPSAQFRQRVIKGVKAGRKRKAVAWIPAFALAAMLALVAGGSIAIWLRHDARDAEVGRLLDLHVATLASANPVDVVSTDRHTVKPWFQGKLPFTFNLPELADSPYKLVGGKLVYLNDHPGAQLLFDLRKHQLSVFIVQESERKPLWSLGNADVREKGFSVETWSQDGLVYAIVSDAGAGDVRRLGDLLRAPARQ